MIKDRLLVMIPNKDLDKWRKKTKQNKTKQNKQTMKIDNIDNIVMDLSYCHLFHVILQVTFL